MNIFNHLFFVFLLVSLCCFTIDAKHVIKNNINCLAVEKEALLSFARGLTNSSGLLSSWIDEDCCQWSRVVCSNISLSKGIHVTTLDLSNNFLWDSIGDKMSLRGKINFTSLHALMFLDHLDLSLNDFEKVEIDSSIGGLTNLRYLDLSYSSFYGDISPHLGNLSSLVYLSLERNYDLEPTNLRWLANLTSLVYINLGGVQLDKTREGLIPAVNKLTHLEELQLYDCNLGNSSPPYHHLLPINLTSLIVLDLYFNNIHLVPSWLSSITSVVQLDLGVNHLGGDTSEWDLSNFKVLEFLSLYNTSIEGELPRSFENVCKLKHLDLSGNNLNGTMDEFLEDFSSCPNGNSLLYLDISANQLQGKIPASIGLLQNLQTLVLSGNNLSGAIPTSVGLLKNLQTLYLFYNKLSEAIPTSVGLLKNLQTLHLSYNNLNGAIPTSVGLLKNLETLDLSYNNLSGAIPEMAIGQLEELYYLSLQGNHYEGYISEKLFMNLTKLEHFGVTSEKVVFNAIIDWVPPFRLTHLSIEDCFVGPKFPKWILVQTDLTHLTLRNVGISDIFPVDWMCAVYPKLNSLDLSKNHISGDLPGCIGVSDRMLDFDISSNNLTGMLPSSIFNSSNLETLLLSNNHLEGELPVSLRQSSLYGLDLGDNMLSGSLPKWSPARVVLRLKSNYFHGPIPEQWCDNPYLHILDLANNNLSGLVPQCINNLTAMSTGASSYNWPAEEIHESAKGKVMEYTTITHLLKIIDFSRNNLSGKIPEDLMNLTGLGTLNLSMNHLIGKIPENIGNLGLLETLDSSNNNLSGQIPQSISSMTFLNYLNLSYNNFQGRIPSGYQLQTLEDPSMYEGNPLLCGVPLAKKCFGDEEDSSNANKKNDDEETKEGEDMKWFYISMVAGYVFGLVGVCLVLWVSMSFRKNYFGFFRLY